MRWTVVVCGLMAGFAASLEAAPRGGHRGTLDLTGPGWTAWRDTEAVWRDDVLVLPDDVDLDTLPVHPPTGDWETLDGVGTPCALPASVEEVFSDGSGVWTYHGVTWFWRDVEVPASWRDRVVRLHVGQARQRLEVYVDGRLAGYDIVAETPVVFDLSGFLRPGATQRLAFRITNPGGQRGWEDAPVIEWGEARLVPGHDFGGVAGRIALEATAPTFVEDVFVASLPPVEERRVEIRVAFDNTRAEARAVTVAVEIRPWPEGDTLLRHVWDESLPAGERANAKWVLVVPGAELWDLDTPRLHVAEVTVSDGDGVLDRTQARFGFRVFEVKANRDGEHNLYLNGRRVRLRSAIDWGYYALTGFYATAQTARRSVEAAKAVGHNALSFHRRIGDPLVMEAADERGLLLYEEPGGFTETLRELTAGPPDWAKRPSFEGRMMLEKIRRMVRRDRNHPSLVAYNLMNERSPWGRLQKRAFDLVADLDGTRLVVNQSGGQGGGSSGPIPHLRPFEEAPRLDFVDDHTVGCPSRFQESDLRSHRDVPTSELWTEERGTSAADAARSIVYWGEVRCHTGPDSWVELAALRSGRPEGHPGYDWASFQERADAVTAYVSRNGLISAGRFQTAADLTRQAARGLMYADGRLGQTILTGSHTDGYAINGWSGTHLDLGDDPQAWYSAIVDEGRHLKGPAEDMAYWTRGLQVAIRRQNGTVFAPGETARFDVHLINEGRLQPGEYRLRLGVLDGDGEPTPFLREETVAVKGGDVHAQALIGDLEVVLGDDWKAGHVTVTAELRGGGVVVADGAEQVLLMNRASWGPALTGLRGAVFGWAGASAALEEAGAELVSLADPGGRLDYVAAGEVPSRAALTEILTRVQRDGTRLVVRFDAAWAQALLDAGLLARPVTTWGGAQTGHWNGDGWGYLDFLVGDRAVPSGPTIGTNSWEVPGDPVGFAPFEASVPQTSYGAHFSRTGPILTLVGALDHGVGTILLLPAYPVDDRHPLNDLLFFHALTKGVRS